MLKQIFFSAIFALSILSATPGFAEDAQQEEVVYSLTRGELRRIKVFSNEADNIQMYLTDKQNNTFRFSGMTEKEIQYFLDQLRQDETFLLKVIENHKKKYWQVMGWENVE